MNGFADRMKSFTENLTASIREREESLDRVHKATDGLLEDAREFLADVSENHRTMAKELHETMASNRAERCEKAHALRMHHRESLGQMKAELRTMLSTTNKTRHDAVTELHEGIQTAQRELAEDLASAGRTWRAFAASR